MKTQQAPSPVQSALLLPAIVAFLIAQSKIGGTTSQRRTSTSRVSSVFVTELKRLRRSQSITRAGAAAAVDEAAEIATRRRGGFPWGFFCSHDGSTCARRKGRERPLADTAEGCPRMLTAPPGRHASYTSS